MGDTQTQPQGIQGLPPGAIAIPIANASATSDVDPSTIKGLPPGAKLIPYSASNQPNAHIQAAPKPFTLPWLKSKFYTAADATADSLPAAGATIGAGIGATGGTFAEPGGGSVLGGIGGAGIGGMAGSAGKHIIRHLLGFDLPTDVSGNDVASDISKEGVTQGAIEAVTGGLARIAPWLKGTAIGQYERALAPTTKINKAIAQDIAPQMVKRGIHGSLESIEDQARQQASQLRPQLDQAYEDLTAQKVLPPIKGLLPPAPTDVPLAPSAKPLSASEEFPGVLQTRDPQIANRAGLPQEAPTAVKPSQPVPVAQLGARPSVIPDSGSKIVGDLENLKSRYVVNGASANPTAVNAISGVQDIVKQYGNDISPNSLRKLKQIFDDPVAAKGGYAGADLTTQYSVKAQKAAANSIRDIIHQASPDIASLDKEISFWLNVQKVAGASAMRRTGQEGGLLKVLSPLAGSVGLGTGVATHNAEHGVLAAGATTLAGLTAHAVQLPAWRTTSAVVKDRLADALARGSVGDAVAIIARLGVAARGASQQQTQSSPDTQ